MFGFSLFGMVITLFGTLSAISTFIILACCVVAGKSSKREEAAFRSYLLQKQMLANLADTSSTEVAHRNYSTKVSSSAAKVGHRTADASPSQADKVIEQAKRAANNEQAVSIVKE